MSRIMIAHEVFVQGSSFEEGAQKVRAATLHYAAIQAETEAFDVQSSLQVIVRLY
jgi:hypothetical protein